MNIVVLNGSKVTCNDNLRKRLRPKAFVRFSLRGRILDKVKDIRSIACKIRADDPYISGSLVIDMLASGGHPDPPIWSRVVWATLEGLVAAALLIAGGLNALQAGALATALPFSIVLLLMCWANVRALKQDHRIQEEEALRQQLNQASEVISQQVSRSPELESFVDDRIDYRLQTARNVWTKRR